MKIVHRVAFASSPQIQGELAAFGISVKGDGICFFEIEESARIWPEVQKWTAMHDVVVVSDTEFSSKEVEEAAWLSMRATGHFGYPQPDDGWCDVTYDTRDSCSRCGVGGKQKAPFRMIGEPRWGRRGILQMNGIFDEYFVTPEVWLNIFKRNGVECLPVLNKKGIALKSVVQLVVREEVSVVTNALQSEEPECSSCGRTKYSYVVRGVCPALVSEPKAAIVKTVEWFGSGGSAFKMVLVSQALARDILARPVRGVSFYPTGERNVLE